MVEFRGIYWAGREALRPFRDTPEKRLRSLSEARKATPSLARETTGSHKPVVPVDGLSILPALPGAGTAVLVRIAVPGTTGSLAEWGGDEGNTPGTAAARHRDAVDGRRDASVNPGEAWQRTGWPSPG